jgi:hypothetical protein
MKAIRSFETSVFTRATRRYIPKGGILQANFLFSNIHSCSIKSPETGFPFLWINQHEWPLSSSIWQHCTRRIDVWGNIWRHISKWRLMRKQCAYFGFSTESSLSKRNVVKNSVLPNVGYNRFKRLVMLHCQSKRLLGRKLSTAWTSYMSRKARMLKLFDIL